MTRDDIGRGVKPILFGLWVSHIKSRRMCLVFSGTILKEDDGLIEPIDLAVILLTSYLDTLDPELFPEEDRPGMLTLCHYVENI